MVCNVFLLQHLQTEDLEETDRQLQAHHAEVHEKRLYERRPTERMLYADRGASARLAGYARLPQNALVLVSKTFLIDGYAVNHFLG